MASLLLLVPLLQGFDAKGAERFWTVTGDNVAAMTFCDVDGDGRNELLVRSNGMEICLINGGETIQIQHRWFD